MGPQALPEGGVLTRSAVGEVYLLTQWVWNRGVEDWLRTKRKKLELPNSGQHPAQELKFSVAVTTNPRAAAAAEIELSRLPAAPLPDTVAMALPPDTKLSPAVPLPPEETPPPLVGMIPAETPAGEPDWSVATGRLLDKTLVGLQWSALCLGSDTEKTAPQGGTESGGIEESPPHLSTEPVGPAVAKVAGGGKAPQGAGTGEVAVPVKQEEEEEEEEEDK